VPRLDIYVNYEHQATITLMDDEVLIGRDDKCAVKIPNERVSRVHAIIRACGDGHEIENRGANGTRVNGRRIEAPRALEPGDSVFIARYILVYQPDDAPVAELDSTVLD
jgi:pSer/pThr/pTyr-binding forkhead associated (FHA) protein